MEFVLNRNKTVTSLAGHSIRFIKDEPTHVPRDMYRDVQAIGAVPVAEIENDDDKKFAEEPTGDERSAVVQKAIREMLARGKRGDFSANNIPNIKQLSLLVGFQVDARERDTEWEAVQLSDTPQAE